MSRELFWPLSPQYLPLLAVAAHQSTRESRVAYALELLAHATRLRMPLRRDLEFFSFAKITRHRPDLLLPYLPAARLGGHIRIPTALTQCPICNDRLVPLGAPTAVSVFTASRSVIPGKADVSICRKCNVVTCANWWWRRSSKNVLGSSSRYHAGAAGTFFLWSSTTVFDNELLFQLTDQLVFSGGSFSDFVSTVNAAIRRQTNASSKMLNEKVLIAAWFTFATLCMLPAAMAASIAWSPHDGPQFVEQVC
jgi:hypothetical protein